MTDKLSIKLECGDVGFLGQELKINSNRATLVGDKCTHHCTIPAPLLKSWFCFIFQTDCLSVQTTLPIRITHIWQFGMGVLSDKSMTVMKWEELCLTSSVRYEIVGKLCDTTNLKATAVNRRVRVTLSRSEGEVISTENEQNDRISMRNWKYKKKVQN